MHVRDQGDKCPWTGGDAGAAAGAFVAVDYCNIVVVDVDGVKRAGADA
ncbi:MAG: hypothetical protein MUF22_03845 [Chitinispirillaceae bacterium]|nr:hypothetical protein [Chitinispirillaceae bacterium]